MRAFNGKSLFGVIAVALFIALVVISGCAAGEMSNSPLNASTGLDGHVNITAKDHVSDTISTTIHVNNSNSHLGVMAKMNSGKLAVSFSDEKGNYLGKVLVDTQRSSGTVKIPSSGDVNISVEANKAIGTVNISEVNNLDGSQTTKN